MEAVIENKQITKYPAYKDSGVEWLGDIPEHWGIKRVKFVLNYQKGKNPQEIVLEETENIYLSMEYLRSGNSRIQYIKSAKGLISVIDDDILLLWDGSNAGEFIRGKKGILSSTMALIRMWSINKKFSWYFLKVIEKQLRESTVGMGIPHVSGEEFKNLLFLTPPKEEQTAIAQFLDRKTAQIDKAIAIKEKQIALLTERRQILIHRAVTRGLDPTVPMKDSGVEWIGEIPEHWEIVTKMKFISSLKGRQGWQGLKADEYKDEGPYVLSSAHFNNYIIDWEKCPRVTIERYLMDVNIQLKIGDILLMKDGANMGKLALVENLPGKACLNSHLLLFRSLHKNETPYYFPKYLFYHMTCSQFQDYVKVNGTGSTFLGISQESIGNYPICLPSIEEQKEISEWIDINSQKITSTISIKEKEIEKLKEYKASLINSVVTGKIKVC